MISFKSPSTQDYINERLTEYEMNVVEKAFYEDNQLLLMLLGSLLYEMKSTLILEENVDIFNFLSEDELVNFFQSIMESNSDFFSGKTTYQIGVILKDYYLSMVHQLLKQLPKYIKIQMYIYCKIAEAHVLNHLLKNL